ncbi:MAG: ubiquinol-cytochrome c reductase iron-sulfur subunit [Deltaproteobacteria bacterium]|nr:ubiquinol-cytochrome c reductase iron-sulfur subunit [Deltaproteobacteria bacterium]
MTAEDHPQSIPANRNRRNFINIALGTLTAIFTASLFYPLFRFLWPSADRSGGEGRIGIPLEELLVGQSRVVVVRGEPVLVIREANKVAAVSAVCTHMSCVVKYRGAGVIACPCHTATFDLNGNVMGGPAPRPLPSYPVRIEGRNIVVGT